MVLDGDQCYPRVVLFGPMGATGLFGDGKLLLLLSLSAYLTRKNRISISMRPKPTVLAEFNRGYYREEVLEAKSISYLTYRGEPVNYRVTNTLTDEKQYPKTSSVNPAFILRLADGLNKLYHTQDFAVTTIKGSNETTRTTTGSTGSTT